MAAVLGAAERNCRVQPGQAARLVEKGADVAFVVHDKIAAAISRPEIDAQPQLAGDVGGGGKLLRGLAPCAVEQGCDGQRRGDPVAQQLREGIALLERQRVGIVHLVWATIHVGLRPDTPLAPGGLVVEAKDRRVEVGQRIEVDETRRDQRAAERVAVIDIAGEITSDEDDVRILIDDFAVRDQAMAAGFVADNPVRRQPPAHVIAAPRGSATGAPCCRAAAPPASRPFASPRPSAAGAAE
jgi:hypothetical protein